MPGSLPTCRSGTTPSVVRDHPAPRVVLYFTGDPGSDYGNVFSLSAAVETQGWQVVEVRSDVSDVNMAWLRKGLLSAITLVCHGRADGVAMFKHVYEALTTDDQNWLNQRVKRFGGFLHIVPDEGSQA